MASLLDAPIAHPGQPLRDHLTGVSRLARSFATKLALDQAGELIGLLHDFGKYSSDFQRYIKSATGLVDADEDEYVDAGALKGKVDHSSAGAQFLWNTLSARGREDAAVGQILALCIASHHSGLIDCISAAPGNFGEDSFAARMQKSRERTHLDECVRAADGVLMQQCEQLLQRRDIVDAVLGRIRRVLERNTIDSRMHAVVFQQQIGLLVRFLFSCLLDADRIDTADFERPRHAAYRSRGLSANWGVLIDRLEAHLNSIQSDRPIDDLRRRISQDCLDASVRPGGAYTLTVPTGGGKTLASLRFALHHAKQRALDRVVYVVPFTSIIDQNARVARSILETADSDIGRGEFVLEHHASITPEVQTWREKVLCENWDAPVIFTTMVQFLESLFGSGTRGARRMHQLANSVLVFDEIQTLPVKCVHLFNNAVNFLVEQCNSTVLLCTATQPLLHKVDDAKGAIRLAPGHEVIRDVRTLFDDLRRVEIRYERRPGGWPHADIARLAMDEMRRAGSCLVIVNTKESARVLFQICRERLARRDEVFHLSTDMCPAHRKVVLGTVLERLAREEPVICLSTQLIEAGVDADFGAVVRFLAGLDSIAQAAGRCNRNGRLKSGVVHVVNPRDERLDSLPDISKGRDQAERVLQDFVEDPFRYGHDLVGPLAMNEFYRYYFFDRRKEMDYPVSARALGYDDTVLNLLSSNTQAVTEMQRRNGAAPDLILHQSFMTAARAFKAIDAPTQGVVVPYGPKGKEVVGRLHGVFDVELDSALLREAQQFTVNVFPNVLEKLRSAGVVTEVKAGARILTLDERYYSPDFGLSAEQVADLESLYVDSKQH